MRESYPSAGGEEPGLGRDERCALSWHEFVNDASLPCAPAGPHGNPESSKNPQSLGTESTIKIGGFKVSRTPVLFVLREALSPDVPDLFFLNEMDD